MAMSIQTEEIKNRELLSIQLQETRKRELLLQRTRKQKLLGKQLLQRLEGMAEAEEAKYWTFLTLLAYTLLFFTMLINHSLVKYSFEKAAMLLLWTSGDVEKHPGPQPLDYIKSIRQLTPRLLKALQGKKVVDWSAAPADWEKAVPFKDINNMTDSDNEEKCAIFYMALYTVIKNLGYVPSWCVEEMMSVETGNAAELHKCQTAGNVRELLEQYDCSDPEDTPRRARYPRERQQQRQKKCPFNIPGYRSITKIRDAETARKLAIACMSQSKNGGKYHNGYPHQQTATKRPATARPIAPKRPCLQSIATSIQPSKSSVVQPNKSSALPSVVICVQPATSCSTPMIVLPIILINPTLTTSTSNAGSDSSSCSESKGSSKFSTGAKFSAIHNNQPLNHSGQSSNNVSRGTPETSNSERQQPGPSGKPSNDDSRGTSGSMFPDSQHPGPSGQASNDGSRWIAGSTAPYIQDPGSSGQTLNDGSRGIAGSTVSNSQQPSPPSPSGQSLYFSSDVVDKYASKVGLEEFIAEILKGT